MLHIEDSNVRKHILDGNFGLEKESLRVLGDGTISHTPHPFPDDDHIVKDFCENQTEINTGVHPSAHAAIEELHGHNERIFEKLQSLDEKEYLWPFSNPPHIKDEEDIPVAIFEGEKVSKSVYREYLSAKYGRYKMTFSGIHVNYSFSDELLRMDYEASKETVPFREYKDALYLNLAKGLAAYGWILVAVTSASPILDGSYLEKGVYGRDVFTGMSSVRCSEMGYWNEFAPVFSYKDLDSYADSIQHYVDRGFLKAPSELYYPIRLKPAGLNNLQTLRDFGVNHIELRMFDLNPLTEDGVEEKDVLFAQLLMIWIAATFDGPFTEQDQVQAVQNFKNAARYDLKTVHLIKPNGESLTIADAALDVIGQMMAFYERLFWEGGTEVSTCPEACLETDAGMRTAEILRFEYQKFEDANQRYAWKIRKQFGVNFAEKAMQLAKERQERESV